MSIKCQFRSDCLYAVGYDADASDVRRCTTCSSATASPAPTFASSSSQKETRAWANAARHVNGVLKDLWPFNPYP